MPSHPSPTSSAAAGTAPSHPPAAPPPTGSGSNGRAAAVVAPATPAATFAAPKQSKSELKRHERVSIFGLDCEDALTINKWAPGQETVKILTLRELVEICCPHPRNRTLWIYCRVGDDLGWEGGGREGIGGVLVVARVLPAET